MRWIITDRSTGNTVTVGQPANQKQRDNLKAGIRNLSRLAVRGGCLYGI